MDRMAICMSCRRAAAVDAFFRKSPPGATARALAPHLVAVLLGWWLFRIPATSFPALWPAGGVLLAALLTGRGGPPILLAGGAFLVELAGATFFLPWTSSLLGGAAFRVALPVLGFLALRTFDHRSDWFRSLHGHLTFLGVAILAPAIPAMLLLLVSGRDPVILLMTMGVLLGMALFAPAMMIAEGPFIAQRLRLPRPLEMLVLLAGVTGGSMLLGVGSLSPLVAVIAPLLLWTALRHGFGATVLLGAVAAVASVITGLAAHPGAHAPAVLGSVDALAALESSLVPVFAMAGTIAAAMEEQRALTAAARARSEELEALVRALPDLVFRLDAKGRILDFRAGQTAQLRVPPESFLGQRMAELLPEEAGRRLEEALRETEHAGGTVRTECELHGSLGAGWFEICTVRLPHDRFLVVMRDVTERHEWERALAARAEALARSNEELQQFAYVASHDLQEPLRTVASFCELLRKRYHGKLGPEADEFIDFAVEGARRMQSLIRDLLDLSRVTTRGRPFADIELAPLVNGIVGELEQTIRETGARIEIAPLPRIRGDARQIAQLFRNLLSNALKYRSDAPPEIRISAEREEDGWHFRVQDNGIGIDEPFRERVFQIFQRLHTREEYPGNGIGLALCRKIVSRHGGRIWVESARGRGSCFHFWLPLAPPPLGESGMEERGLVPAALSGIPENPRPT